MEKERKEESIVVKERFFNVRYAFFFALLMALGVAFCYFRVFEQASFWWLLAFLPIIGCAFFFSSRKKRTLFVFLAFLLAFLSGFFLFSQNVKEYQRQKTFKGEYTVVGTVCEKLENDRQIRLLLSDIRIGEKTSDYKLVAYLSLSFSKTVGLSDRIVLKGEVATYSAFEADGSFYASRVADKIKYSCFSPTYVQKVGKEQNLFLTVRARIQEVVRAGMNEDTAPLTLALLLGYTSGIEEGLLDNIRAGGIAHIFAVSGLHIAALYAFCRLLTDKTGFSRAPAWSRFLFVAAVVVFYGGICGFSASVVRAIVMCLTIYLCRLLWINYDMLDALGLACAVVLALFPTLLFDVGFQLSFTACLGIGLLAGVLRRGMGGDGVWLNRLIVGKEELAWRAARHKNRIPLGITAQIWKWFAGVFSVSLAAQAGTFPVQMSAFGFISGWGLLLNVVFVPIIGGCFSLLLLLVLLASILPIFMASGILFLPSLVWSVLALLFEAVDFSNFLFTGNPSLGVMLAWYTFVIFLSDKLNLKKAKPFFVVGGLFFFALTCCLPYVLRG